MEHEHCRGFECIYFKFQVYPKNRGMFTYCDIPGQRKALSQVDIIYSTCDGCANLNDCYKCFHAKTCKYSLANKEQ